MSTDPTDRDAPRTRQTAAIVGAGTIGAGWAARFLLAGWDVRVIDPDPQAEARLDAILDRARRATAMLRETAPPAEGQLRLCTAISEAVAEADWVQESAPDRLELKRKLFQKIQAHCPTEAVLASSSAGLCLAQLQGCATRPGQILGACPTDPVWLLPLVDIGAADRNDPALVDRAAAVLTSLGMRPLRRCGDGPPLVPALTGALRDEALRMIRAGLATREEIDTALTAGPGPDWAIAGLSGTEGDVPTTTDRARDDALVTVLRALRQRGIGAGARLDGPERATTSAPGLAPRMKTVHRTVPTDWADYNGHMSEGRYGQVFSDAADAVIRALGVDAAYLAGGHSFFTVETTVRFRAETSAGEVIRVATRVTRAEGRKLGLRHEMTGADGALRATCDQVLLHVSLRERRSCDPVGRVAERMRQLATCG